ncbi:MAG: helix-turn-helix domain-containing protein [Nocardioides sp.]
MAKTFAEYAQERDTRLSPEARELGRVFEAAAVFGRVIREARKTRGLRQADLAELSGVTQADISRIERGMIAPTSATLLKLTQALGAQIQLVMPPDVAVVDEARDLVALNVQTA